MTEPNPYVARLERCEKDIRHYRHENSLLRRNLDVLMPLCEWAVREIMAQQEPPTKADDGK